MAARAGARIADQGGNAVDAAIAAALVSLTTDVAFVSPGSNGFLVIWPAGEEPTVIDAYAEVPGRGLPDADSRGRGEKVFFTYAGGSMTFVGYETVVAPGAFAGLAKASENYGRLPWRDLVQPALLWAQRGFPLTPAGEEYFYDAGKEVFHWHPEGREVLAHRSGRKLRAGDVMRIPGLADSLRLIADRGVDCLYGGELGSRISADVVAHGGRVTMQDFEAYEALHREPIRIEVDDWELALNPSPAVGGVTLAAILLLMQRQPLREWDPEGTKRFAEVLRSVFEYRGRHLDGNLDSAAASELLEAARSSRTNKLSPSTVQTSTVDSDGLACSITLSDGYGSGVMVPTTGMWLNNALGEVELFPPDLPLPPPGTRLVSNMAPTIARRRDGSVLAIGSPGADRITSAIAQVLLSVLRLRLPLEEAIERPRLHVSRSADGPCLVHEPGVPMQLLRGWKRKELSARNLYFGSVQAVSWDPRAGLSGAADSRRHAAYTLGGTLRGGDEESQDRGAY